MEQNNTEDDKPIYMIAEAEKGDRDYYGDFNYGFCPLRKYASGSKMTETKKLDGNPHGYGCAGYAVKTTMKFLKLMGWEEDYEKYKTTEQVWNSAHLFQ